MKKEIIILLILLTIFTAGCAVKKDDDITKKNSPPESIIVVSTNETFQFTDITFNGSFSKDADNDTLTYKWDFGDGNTSKKKLTTHKYSSTGTYKISLEVTDIRNIKNISYGEVVIRNALVFEKMSVRISDANLNIKINVTNKGSEKLKISEVTKKYWTIFFSEDNITKLDDGTPCQIVDCTRNYNITIDKNEMKTILFFYQWEEKLTPIRIEYNNGYYHQEISL